MNLHNKIMNLPVVITGDYFTTENRLIEVGHQQARHAAAELALDADVELERVTRERDIAIQMLAEWCVDIDKHGTGWDSWDENYKNAMCRPGELRALLDIAIAKEVAARKPD